MATTGITVTDLIAPSIATISILVSYGACMARGGELRKTSLGDKKWTYPYKPWELNNDIMYRSFRAIENVREWMTLHIPLVWIFCLFASKFAPLAPFQGIFVVAVNLFYSVSNVMYHDGYAKSADGRLKPFFRRALTTMFFLVADVLLIGAAAVLK